MRKIKSLICLLLLSLSLVGCVKDSYEDNSDSVGEVTIAGRNFKSIQGRDDDFGWYEILVDKETKVQYLFNEENHQGGLVVIVDADGKPILYEGEVE